MSGTMYGRTVLPPSDLTDLVRFAGQFVDVEAPARPRLVGPDGAPIEIPEEVYGLLRDVVDALSQGLAVSITSYNTTLTTQEAADLLNISRPALVRLLDGGEIPYTVRDRHRPVLLRDILEYQERTRVERHRALAEM